MTRSPTAARGALIIGLILLIAGGRLVVDEPQLGLYFLLALPIAMSVGAWGFPTGLAVAGLCLALFVVTEAADPHPELEGLDLVVASLTRGVVFLAAAVLARAFLAQGTLLARSDVELDELRALSEALTPGNAPARPHLELATLYVPAEGVVAGDFFLITAGPGESTLIALGDVVGHGLKAARRASFVRACLASFAEQTDDPARLLALTNGALVERTGATSEFVTAVCASVDPLSRTVTYSLAGHPPPILLDTAAAVHDGSVCPPLGVQESITCSPTTVRLEPGAGLLFYSDGLTEARATGASGARAALFGESRARDTLLRFAGAPPEHVVRGLREAVGEYAGSRLADDLCLVAVRIAA